MRALWSGTGEYFTCTSEVIWDVLHPQFVKTPSSEEEWIGVSDQFYRIWNFPKCIGAIDGKHVVMQAPRNAGSSFYNYNGTHSIVLEMPVSIVMEVF